MAITRCRNRAWLIARGQVEYLRSILHSLNAALSDDEGGVWSIDERSDALWLGFQREGLIRESPFSNINLSQFVVKADRKEGISA